MLYLILNIKHTHNTVVSCSDVAPLQCKSILIFHFF